jgi:prepilin-type N-terminal cleavage/methylation domain-containing protein
MSLTKRLQDGFTLVELMVVMTLVGIISTTFYVFFNDSLSQYLALQKDGSEFTDIAQQSQRVGNVLRGLTDIISETNTDITCYAYFSPNDNYVSKIHYYLNGPQTQLLADVTPMSANPPIGVELTAQAKTFSIIRDFYKSPSVNLFTYLDDAGSPMSLPVNDEHAIKGIQVGLAVQGSHSSNQAISIQVTLRNRKTNL